MDKALAEQLYDEAGIENTEDPSEWRRGAPRRVIREYVDIEVQDSGDSMPGSTIDVTPGTIGLCCKYRIPSASTLKISRAYGEQDTCEGVVVHCTRSLTGYRIGIALRAQDGPAPDDEPATADVVDEAAEPCDTPEPEPPAYPEDQADMTPPHSDVLEDA